MNHETFGRMDERTSIPGRRTFRIHHYLNSPDRKTRSGHLPCICRDFIGSCVRSAQPSSHREDGPLIKISCSAQKNAHSCLREWIMSLPRANGRGCLPPHSPTTQPADVATSGAPPIAKLMYYAKYLLPSFLPRHPSLFHPETASNTPCTDTP